MTGTNHVKTNPVGLDYGIQRIQNDLFKKLDWNDCEVFGRVYKVVTKDGFTVKAFTGGKDYKDVFTNDRKLSTIFFIDDDNHKTTDGILFKCQVKIVFMVNLKKILPDISHRADMEVEEEVVKIIRKRSDFEIKEIEKGFDKVLKEFKKEDLQKTDMQPFHVFSINGTISYNINCFN